MMKKNILITGGAGFIGCHVVKLFVEKYPDYNIINLDCLTYAGNLENLREIEASSNYFFEKVNLLDVPELETVFAKHAVTDVIHLAAESHVDRSISDPLAFVKTNVIGTVNLLNVAKAYWGDLENHLFYHISTDEVYGSLEDGGFFTETTPYDPQSPYSASKASSDHFVRAYANTYKMKTVITNCSNNYGPNQFPEKLIPLCIHNIKNNKPLPVYGKGENIRDWLYVVDHAKLLIWFSMKVRQEKHTISEDSMNGKTLISSNCFVKKWTQNSGRESGTSEKLITYVKDRAGHDHRYAIDASKIQKELGWEPSLQFEEGIEKTIDWYLKNEDWLNNVTSGNYQKYYEEHYGG
jgi:dTDP-glucose 4,6-dehydratase